MTTGTSLPSRSARLALFAVALFGIAPGCSDHVRTVPVHGTITYKGIPVPNGTVTFMPAAGPAATGEIQPDGKYALGTYRPGDGAPPGPYTVVVVAMRDQTGLLPEKRNPLPASIVPDIFTSIATSPLRAEVKDQENTIDFDLVPPKK
jgi:hypothetical protein